MQADVIQTIAGYVALTVPVTVALANLSKAGIEWLKQRHEINSARIDQHHQITTNYLDRALDPTVPLAIRHQLLRFLATPDGDGSRLENWAKNELVGVEKIVEETNKALEAAQQELLAAGDVAQVQEAERKLADAIKRQRSLMESPIEPPISAASLRAGLVEKKELKGLKMAGEDLKGAELEYKSLQGSDFERSDCEGADFHRSDLRASSFLDADLKNTSFFAADLRGVNFRGADISKARFRRARLEGADFRVLNINAANNLQATYDSDTLWPDGFDPHEAGAVLVQETDPDN